MKDNKLRKNTKPRVQQVRSMRKNNIINWSWCIKVLLLTLALSIMFSVLSEVALTSASLFVALLVIVILMLIGIAFDCVGVATTACDENVLNEMIASKVRGAKEAMIFVKNAEKVSVICCDIVGDVCGVLCGAAGAAIVTKFIGEGADASLTILVSALVSGVIAGLTIFGKSIEKGLAVNKSEKILLIVGRVINTIFK